MSAVRRIRAAHLLWLAAGFTIWSSGFVLLYGVHALGCRAGWTGVDLGPVSVQRAVLLTIWAGHAAAAAMLFVPLNAAAKVWGGEAGRFLRDASILLTFAAVAATVWTGAPVLFLTVCL